MAGRTNTVSMSYVAEASVGVLPGTPEWKYIEPNNISTYGASITTKARNPISATRGAKKGAVVDLDSAVEFDGDLTMDSFYDFASGFMFATWNEQNKYVPASVASTAYTVTANGAALSAGDLVYARDFTNSENNGLKVVDAGSTTTVIEVEETLVAEASPPTAARVDVVGVQAVATDLSIDSSGDLVSAGTLDFTTLGLVQGQGIYIGGGTTATDFATSPGGYARCKAITATKITLDKTENTLVTDAGTGKTIQIFIGSFIRDVATSDGNFLSTTYQFEQRIPGLDEGTSYIYAKGNTCNTVGFSIPTADLITATWGFVGTDTDVPTTTREASGSWVDPSLTDAMSATADIAKLRLAKADETSLATWTKSLDISINNNAVSEKVVANLGAVDIGYGDFAITGSTEVILENDDIVNAVRNNETVTLDFVSNNDDGAIWVDIPSMTLGSGSMSYPRNELIKVAIDGSAFEDAYFGYSIGITYFPYVPE